jgi:hypothetical protein
MQLGSLKLLLLQMVQVSRAAIDSVVIVRTRVESAVGLGARGVDRLGRGRSPVCGRSAAAIARRHPPR